MNVVNQDIVLSVDNREFFSYPAREEHPRQDWCNSKKGDAEDPEQRAEKLLEPGTAQ